MQVHTGLGEQRGRVQVIGKILYHFAHSIVISLGRLPAIRLGIGGKAQHHSLNVGLLDGRSVGREIDCFLDGVVCRRETLVAGRIVVIRAYSFRDAPVGDGQLGVEIGSALKRARRLIVVEGVDQTQSLIEKLLRLLVACGYGMMQVSQPRHQRCRFGLGVIHVILGDDCAG